jgi:hypothetical protein
MNWTSFDSKQFPSSNQFIVRKTHCKRQELDYTTPDYANVSVDKGLVQNSVIV